METLSTLCEPGLEEIVDGELRDLGFPGGESFQGTLRDAYGANLRLRCAHRVLLRLGCFRAASFTELRRNAGRLAWERFLVPGRPVALRVSCRKSRLYHEGAVAERVAAGIGDWLQTPSPVKKLGEPPDGDPPQLVVIRLDDDLCSVWVDSSGEPLHKRGYRLATAKAPLRETLAAAMLKASGWDATSPLLDPFCGSGTIAIEAALLAKNAAPGARRRFAFMDWPCFLPSDWEAALAEARAAVVETRASVLASDRDAGAVRSAEENARRAGVTDLVGFSCKAVSAVEPPPGPGWVVTNPPYGVRIKNGGDLRDLYARFGEVLRLKFPGWGAAVLCGDMRLLGCAGLRTETRLSTMNGGLSVRLSVARIPQS